MNDKLTTAWAYVVAALIYGIILVTVLMYLGEIVLWIRKLIY
jgi:uncharacterized membrane-anchored protein YhcB (DUF1043 family)